jgi:hypothetical protein
MRNTIISDNGYFQCLHLFYLVFFFLTQVPAKQTTD